MAVWDYEDVAQDLELLRAFLSLRDPLDSLRFGAPGPGQRDPTAEEVRDRAVAYMMAAMRLSRDEHECLELMGLIRERWQAALVQLGYASGGTPARGWWYDDALPWIGRVAYDAPVLLAAASGLVLFGFAGALAALALQPAYAPTLRALLFAGGFLAAFGRLFMPVRGAAWIRAFAWLAVPTLLWSASARLGLASLAGEVIAPRAIPAVPWLLALAGVAAGLRLLRREARHAGLEGTLFYFDPAVRAQAAPASIRSLPGGSRLTPATRAEAVTRRGSSPFLSLLALVATVALSLWAAWDGAGRDRRARDLAAAATARSEAAARAEEEAREREAREAEEGRRELAEAEARRKAEAEEKARQIAELKARLEKERLEKARKQEEIDRLNKVETTALDLPSVLFFTRRGEEADPTHAAGIFQLAPTGWEMLAPIPSHPGDRVIVRGRHAEVGGELAMFADTMHTDVPRPREYDDQDQANLRRFNFRLSGGQYHPNRPNRFLPIAMPSGGVMKGFRWAPERASAPGRGTFVALNPKPGTDVQLTIEEGSATVAIAPTGSSWTARIDRREGYARLRSNESDLPGFLVWEGDARRLYLFLGPSLGDQPFVLVLQPLDDAIKGGRSSGRRTTAWKDTRICVDTGLRANAFCPETVVRRMPQDASTAKACLLHHP